MRIRLKEGAQKELVNKAVQKLGSLKNVGTKLNIPHSTMKKYSQENNLLPADIFDKLLTILSIDKNKLDFKEVPDNWGNSKGGKKGIRIMQEKYRDELQEWRRKGIQKFTHTNTKQIKTPVLNEKLAEFIGAHIGDGTMTKYFLKITGDARVDYPYFAYLNRLVEELFGIRARISKDNKTNRLYLVISSKNVCSFLKNEFGINYGDKIRNNLLIPEKILKDSQLTLACLRGLMDTDGSVSRRGRNGSQFCVVLTSHNKNLTRQIKLISDKHGLFTYISKGEDQIGTNKAENIKKYFKKVGSSNLRHIVRFYLRFFENKTIYQREVSSYYQKDLYRTMTLPYKISEPMV